jgi:hypothetical protein
MEVSGMKRDYKISRMLVLLMVGAGLLLVEGCATLGGKRMPAVTVSQIVKMSKEGVPAQAIIKKMKESGTVYRLKADQLADLEQKGVPGPVINYMQDTYLNAVRRNQQFEDWNYWWQGWDGYWYGGGPFGWPDDGF